jgi:predicted deacylase
MFGLFETNSHLPVADIVGHRSGPTLLVTAGVDGDEYAPIASAYEAAEKWGDGDFAGRLIIVPIVNVSGFDARISENPADGKFPKYCIPGNAWGSASERLMHYITHTYARHASLWLDLHSGAMGEVAINCLWNDITGTADVDARGKAFTHASGVQAAVREAAKPTSRALARFGCTYVLAESEDENTHVAYIERAMHTLGMLPGTLTAQPPRIFSKTRDMHSLDEVVGDGEMVLWHKIKNQLTKDVRVGEIAYDEQSG